MVDRKVRTLYYGVGEGPVEKYLNNEDLKKLLGDSFWYLNDKHNQLQIIYENKGSLNRIFTRTGDELKG